ncbi:uncharacterized protein V6R79_024128 [Siganus canaliculatus]
MTCALHFLLLVLFSLSVAEAQLTVFDLRASDLPANILATTDGFVEVSCGSFSLGKTAVRRNTVSPWWEEEFTYFKAQENDTLVLEVYDSDILFDDLLGTCERQIVPGTHEHDCFLKKGGTLHYAYTLG